MLNGNSFIDGIMQSILNAIMAVINVVFSFIFSNIWITLIFWFLLTNFSAIFLMKKDKQYAQENSRRIRESTLLTIALAGGALRNVLCYVQI